ncbi:hypothetical protein ZWY2020_038438 [Hordeum vulgare]|nr:hypothetical protein ZWY2020_038438 [Hordeum vulgare]
MCPRFGPARPGPRPAREVKAAAHPILIVAQRPPPPQVLAVETTTAHGRVPAQRHGTQGARLLIRDRTKPYPRPVVGAGNGKPVPRRGHREITAGAKRVSGDIRAMQAPKSNEAY